MLEVLNYKEEIFISELRWRANVATLSRASRGAIAKVRIGRRQPAYYFHSVPFIAKLSLFAAIGLLSIYPTRQFLLWRPALRQGVAPAVEPGRLHALRRVIHWELALGVVLILCAALMARGIGYVGA